MIFCQAVNGFWHKKMIIYDGRVEKGDLVVDYFVPESLDFLLKRPISFSVLSAIFPMACEAGASGDSSQTGI